MFVLVDQLVHVVAHDVLGVLLHVQFVSRLPNDSHRKAPPADGLATQPGPEKASERGIQERDDATDAGQALNTSETSTQEPRARSRPFCSLCTAPCCRTGGTSGAGGAGRCATARDYPVENDDPSQNTADGGVGRVRCAATDHRP